MTCDEAGAVIETHEHKGDFVSLTPAGEFTDAMASNINNVLEKQSESPAHFLAWRIRGGAINVAIMNKTELPQETIWRPFLYGNALR